MELNMAEGIVKKEETYDNEMDLFQPRCFEMDYEMEEGTWSDVMVGRTGLNGEMKTLIKEEWQEDGVKVEGKEENSSSDDPSSGATWNDVVMIKLEPDSNEEDCGAVDSIEETVRANNKIITRKPGVHACHECFYETKSRRQFQSHVQNHRSSGHYKCQECSYRSSSANCLKVHILRDHQDKSEYSCYTCGYITYLKRLLRKHMRKHMSERVLVRKSCLQEHVRLSGEVKRKNFFYCDVCDFKTNQAGYLESHMRIHTEKLYTCEACNYSCSKKATLEAHSEVHKRKKSNQCSRCDLKVNDLKNHAHVHSGEKRYACDECEFRTNRVSNLKTHVKRKHTGEKPFSCRDCEYRCTSASDLRRHEATHTGLKLFVCDYCGYECSRRDVLVTHTRSHTGEKPYTCDKCGHASSTLTSLKLHKLVHFKKRKTAND